MSKKTDRVDEEWRRALETRKRNRLLCHSEIAEYLDEYLGMDVRHVAEGILKTSRPSEPHGGAVTELLAVRRAYMAGKALDQSGFVRELSYPRQEPMEYWSLSSSIRVIQIQREFGFRAWKDSFRVLVSNLESSYGVHSHQAIKARVQFASTLGAWGADAAEMSLAWDMLEGELGALQGCAPSCLRSQPDIEFSLVRLALRVWQIHGKLLLSEEKLLEMSQRLYAQERRIRGHSIRARHSHILQQEVRSEFGDKAAMWPLMALFGGPKSVSVRPRDSYILPIALARGHVLAGRAQLAESWCLRAIEAVDHFYPTQSPTRSGVTAFLRKRRTWGRGEGVPTAPPLRR